MERKGGSSQPQPCGTIGGLWRGGRWFTDDHLSLRHSVQTSLNSTCSAKSTFTHIFPSSTSRVCRNSAQLTNTRSWTTLACYDFSEKVCSRSGKFSFLIFKMNLRLLSKTNVCCTANIGGMNKVAGVKRFLLLGGLLTNVAFNNSWGLMGRFLKLRTLCFLHMTYNEPQHSLISSYETQSLSFLLLLSCLFWRIIANKWHCCRTYHHQCDILSFWVDWEIFVDKNTFLACNVICKTKQILTW